LNYAFIPFACFNLAISLLISSSAISCPLALVHVISAKGKPMTNTALRYVLMI
jgi:hypothetical protein